MNNIIWKKLDIFNIKKDRYLINSVGDIFDKELNNCVKYAFYNGYYTCALYTNDNIMKSYFVHKLVAYTFYMVRPINNDIINHKDLNKLNNKYENLEFTTNSGNTRHAIENHARKLVEQKTEPVTTNRANYNAIKNLVFNENDIHNICKLMEQNKTYPDILEILGFPVTKNRLDILTKIRTGNLWGCISSQYNIPNKEFRSKAIHYSDEQVEFICSMIKNNCSLKQISDAINVDISDKKEYDKFAHFIRRIKDKKTYSRISNNYF